MLATACGVIDDNVTDGQTANEKMTTVERLDLLDDGVPLAHFKVVRGRRGNTPRGRCVEEFDLGLGLRLLDDLEERLLQDCQVLADALRLVHEPHLSLHWCLVGWGWRRLLQLDVCDVCVYRLERRLHRRQGLIDPWQITRKQLSIPSRIVSSLFMSLTQTQTKTKKKCGEKRREDRRVESLHRWQKLRS